MIILFHVFFYSILSTDHRQKTKYRRGSDYYFHILKCLSPPGPTHLSNTWAYHFFFTFNSSASYLFFCCLFSIYTLDILCYKKVCCVMAMANNTPILSRLASMNKKKRKKIEWGIRLSYGSWEMLDGRINPVYVCVVILITAFALFEPLFPPWSINWRPRQLLCPSPTASILFW